MSGIVQLGRKIRSFKSSPLFSGYSKVVIIVADDVEYSAGTDSGRTLQLECPWGTQQMAENILEDISGWQYQPYTADGAFLDPAAELGDDLSVNGIVGGIYSMSIEFGKQLRANLSAPADEEIDHEYPYVPKQNRAVKRSIRNLTAELKVQAGLISAEVNERREETESLSASLKLQSEQISAKISKTSGTSASSFGWDLKDVSWSLNSNGQIVLYADKDGLEVKGKITALSGTIGGFTIESNYLSYNDQTWNGSKSSGAYLGVSGLQMGENFKVDMAGNLEAYSGKFTGTVYAGSIQYGSSAGTLSGSAITAETITGGKVAGYTLTNYNMNSGISTSLGRADYSYNVCTGITTASKIITQELSATSKASVESLYIGGTSVRKKSTTFKDADGNNVTISYWG